MATTLTCLTTAAIVRIMHFDISPLLNEWEYRPGQIDVRKFKGKDGVEKIQLRVDLGLLQMNAEGRPDGKRPFGHESLLEHYESRLIKFIEEHKGEDEGFHLTPEDCAKLQQEAIQFHHRYICLFQLQDYGNVIRDTDRNLRVFDFVERYAESGELGFALQQFRPQLLMMQTRAKGSMALEANDHPTAIELVTQGIEQIRAFYRKHSRLDLMEQSGEIHSLESWLNELQASRPLTKREKLEKALREAVQREDYEKAAKVRDSLKKLDVPQ
jgi:hypothetical protein